MSYRPRDEPDAVWHLTARVNWQEWHLASDEAYEQLVRALEFALRTFQVDLLSFVVMANHFHAVLRSPGDDDYARLTTRRTPCGHWRRYPQRSPRATVLGQFTRQLMLQSANTIQELLGLKGHLWEARHHRRRVLDARQLVFCIAYDHRNPTRAGIVSRPEQFPRSSASWWAAGGRSDLRIAKRRPLPFGFDLAELRGKVLEYQESKVLDDVARAWAQSRLRMDSGKGAAQLAHLLDRAKLPPIKSAALPTSIRRN